MTARRGFTVVEVLLVVAILAIAVRIAMPNVDRALDARRAAQVLDEVSTVRVAAARYAGRHSRWPADAPPGRVPPGLEAFLDEGYSFERDGFRLDWERWELPDGLPGDPDVRWLAAVTVVPASPDLEAALRAAVAATPGWFVVGDHYTFVAESGR